MPLIPLKKGHSASVRIGRFAIRLVLLALIGWGITGGHHAYIRYKLAQEIDPIHTYAREVFLSLKKGDCFAVQEKLDPRRQYRVSVDWLAHFAENAELNATNRLIWGGWIKTEAPTTRYNLQGIVQYKTGHTQPLKMTIQKDDTNLNLLQLRLGKRMLLPTSSPSFP